MRRPSLRKQYAYAVFIYFMGYLYSIIYAPNVSLRTDPGSQRINDLHEACFIDTENFNFSKTRGENYYIDIMDEQKQKLIQTCFLTFWGASHIILYTFLGIFCPDLFVETLLVGISFEMYELVEYDCHDLLDIGMNTIGFLIGSHISNTFVYT